MEIQQLYYATVIDNIYKDMSGVLSKNGRVQIKVPELHAETQQNYLPWARPFSLLTGGGSSQGVSNIPEINSKVWVFFSDGNNGAYRKPFYIADGSLDNFNPHTLFSNNIASSIGSASVYPNTKYYYFQNGICIGVDSSTSNPEIFIYHPNASIFIDKTGNITVKGTTITFTAGATNSQPSILGNTLKTILSSMLDGIVALTVTCTAPSSPSSPPINAAVFTALKNQLSTILSPNIKNN